MRNSEYSRLIGKARDVKHGGRESWGVLSTGEKVAVALVLNRADWLTDFGYTIAEAIDRTGTEWVALIPKVARELARRRPGTESSVDHWRAAAHDASGFDSTQRSMGQS